MRGGAKDFVIATAWAIVADIIACGLQQFLGQHMWLPSGSFMYAFTFASLFYSRHPIWERR